MNAGAFLSYTQQSCQNGAMKLRCALPFLLVTGTALDRVDFRPLNSVSSVSNVRKERANMNVGRLQPKKRPPRFCALPRALPPSISQTNTIKGSTQ